MEKILGKYNEALVYASVIEEKAAEQIRSLCDLEIYKDSKIRIMPDVHAGAGCTIGTTMTLHGAVTPNLVGVDIGCGMETVEIAEKEIDFLKLDALIRREIPSGREVREKKHANAALTNVFELRCFDRRDMLEAELKAVGSLGGGNHFIEVDKDEEGRLYIVIHSGSRHLGKEVAEFYQQKAWEQINGRGKEEIEEIIRELKEQGREKEIQSVLKALKGENREDVPKDLAWLSGELYEDYIHDMKIMQEFAMINRQTMMQIILEGMGLHEVDRFSTIHNYIDTEKRILRKGSVSAEKGEKLLIPINMRDGSLICIGKGNPDWNCSAPHGAGRIMSRNEAFRTLDTETFLKEMEGVFTTTANSRTLDESPMAYKGMEDIVANIGPTAEILKVIKPVYNFKADE
ncbi:MAG: RtcB family protein [Erysipelotrichaceae bacterium]|nr:RtcB family protein [Erysipelotrichaceae bacterium]MBR3168778.1 RtcB family protein [Erysipelotrichaceae bacterium]